MIKTKDFNAESGLCSVPAGGETGCEKLHTRV